MDSRRPQNSIDLFIGAGELSGDLHGAELIRELLKARPHLQIGAVAGPKMRELKIHPFFQMEKLQVMGFIDVLLSLPKIISQFLKIKKKILELNPKAIVFIDYPGMHLRLEKSLRKSGYKGKLIHFISPTIWAWRKNRIFTMEKNLDLLLTIFPFEKKYFSNSPLRVEYIGHPLIEKVEKYVPTDCFKGQKILTLFPGSRKKEIERNLPLQLKVGRKLAQLDPSLKIVISATTPHLFPKIHDAIIVGPKDNYELMRASHLAIATSGTVTLELALHQTPTIVGYAIKPLDRFIAQKIFRINLPFYCIVNIIASKQIFPELFGPHLTEENLYLWAEKFWFDANTRAEAKNGCQEVRKSLGFKDAALEAANSILSIVDF